MSCTTRSCSSSPYSYTWAPIWLIPVLEAADRALQRRWQRCLWTNAQFFVGQPKKRLFVTIVTMKPGRICI